MSPTAQIAHIYEYNGHVLYCGSLLHFWDSILQKANYISSS